VVVSRGRHAKPEEGLNQTPGELVPAEKVEEILHGLDLPATGEPEDSLAAPPDEYERGSEEEEPAEESLTPEDPVRLYLREIGRIHLLNSEQEVRLGQQIERGQEKVRRAIMAVPLVRSQLMDLAERLRRREVDSDQYLEALDGTELTETELRRVQNVFTQIRDSTGSWASSRPLESAPDGSRRSRRSRSGSPRTIRTACGSWATSR
jgi:RNA polymerase primary sigma factor